MTDNDLMELPEGLRAAVEQVTKAARIGNTLAASKKENPLAGATADTGEHDRKEVSPPSSTPASSAS